MTLNGDVSVAAGDSGTVLDGDVELGGITFESEGELNFGNDPEDTLTVSSGDTRIETSEPGSGINVAGDLDGEGNISLTSEGDLNLDGDVTLDGGLALDTEGGSGNVNVGGSVEVETLSHTGGTGSTTFESDVNVSGEDENGVGMLLDGNEIDFEGDVSVSTGGLVDKAAETNFNEAELNIAGAYTKENESGQTFIQADEVERIMQNAEVLKGGSSEVVVITATESKGITTGGDSAFEEDLFINDDNLQQLAADFKAIVVGELEQEQNITISKLEFIHDENASVTWQTGGSLDIEGEIVNQTASLSFVGRDLDTTDVAVKSGGQLSFTQTSADTLLLDMKIRSLDDVVITSGGDIDLSGMDLLTTGTLTVRAGGSIIVGSSILVASNGVIFEADSDGDGSGLIDIASGSTSYVTAQTGGCGDDSCGTHQYWWRLQFCCNSGSEWFSLYR